jgi:chemotaxis protein CheZ
VQRKVFRVERMLADRRAARPSDNPASGRSGHFTPPKDSAEQPLKRELAELKDAIARTMDELSALVGDGHDRPLARAAGKLGAAIEGMEKATEAILKSAEVIDDSAKALAAASKTDYARGLTQEIQDHVVKVYEACNFQDLGGQRISSVIETLGTIETQIDGMLARHRIRAGTGEAEPRHDLLNGPRLDGDSGHTSQQDIDLMFD